MLGKNEAYTVEVPNSVYQIANNVSRLTKKEISIYDLASFLIRKLELCRDQDDILLAQQACDYIMFSDGFIVDLPAYESTPLFRELYTENIKCITAFFQQIRTYLIDSYFASITSGKLLFYRSVLNVHH